MSSAEPSSREIIVPVGAGSVTMLEPPTEQEEGERLSMWWGVTTAAATLAGAIGSGEPLQGSRVIELGCGLGLAGIAAALQGGQVTFCDGVAEALRHARRNAERNQIARAQTSFCEVRWDEPSSYVDLGTFDLILGSEIAYDYFYHDDLLKLLDTLCGPGGTILLADRPRLVIERFLGRLVAKGFRCDAEPQHVQLPMLPSQEVSLYRLVRV